jgi:hypothetical protein
MFMDKKPNPQPAISVSLGSDPQEVRRRIDELDRLAKTYKVKRSTLFQMIADGKLEVVPPRPRQTA